MTTTSFTRWLDGWEPPPTVVDDAMDPAPLLALAAALDRVPPDPAAVPPLWHWLYFARWPPTDELGHDGHPTAGPLLPPVPERTRVFGGGRVTFRAPLRCSVPAQRRSTVDRWTIKEGRSGTMLLVTEHHEIEQGGNVVLVEEHDLVYRSGPAPGRTFTELSPAEPVTDWPWQTSLPTSPVVLFRMSALTANSHRIHYDHPYVTSVEGYPGLVVHGPLLAIAMVSLVADADPGRSVASLSFRLHRPVFAGERVLVTGRPADASAELAVVGHDGEPRASATVELIM